MTDPLIQLDNQLCFALYAASRAVTQAYRPRLEELGLTYPQYLVMLVLWETDDVPLKLIGERLMLDSGTLTPLVRRLESQERITRVRDQDDERRIRIRLMPKGRRLAKRARKVPTSLLCKLDAPEDLQAVVRMRDELKLLIARLSDHN